MKYIEINFQTQVFLPVRVKPFFASLDKLHILYSLTNILFFPIIDNMKHWLWKDKKSSDVYNEITGKLPSMDNLFLLYIEFCSCEWNNDFF